MDKRYLTVKTLIGMLYALILALLISQVLYAYSTPKVYVTHISKGILAGKLYDCVIPIEALHDGTTVYVVSVRDTVLGKRYRVRGENVIVEAEENGMAAIHFYANDGMMIVLAHDGRMKGNGDVLVYGS